MHKFQTYDDEWDPVNGKILSAKTVKEIITHGVVLSAKKLVLVN